MKISNYGLIDACLCVYLYIKRQYSESEDTNSVIKEQYYPSDS